MQAGTLDWAALSDHARAVAYLTQRPDWEDIAQEALLRLWASPAGRNQIHCRRWLAMAVRNIAIDRLRAAAVRERHGRGHTLSLDSLVLADPGSDSKRWTLLADLITGGGGTDPGELVAVRLTIWPLYRRLPPAYRHALGLRALGCRQREIARALRIPPGTVKSRLYYATTLMRRMLVDAEAV